MPSRTVGTQDHQSLRARKPGKVGITSCNRQMRKHCLWGRIAQDARSAVCVLITAWSRSGYTRLGSASTADGNRTRGSPLLHLLDGAEIRMMTFSRANGISALCEGFAMLWDGCCSGKHTQAFERVPLSTVLHLLGIRCQK